MGEAAAKEPTMEDILASIRRIISQDDQPQQQPSAAAPVDERARERAPEVQPQPPVQAQPGNQNQVAAKPAAQPELQGQAAGPEPGTTAKPPSRIGELAALAGEITGSLPQSPSAAARQSAQSAAAGNGGASTPAPKPQQPSVLAERRVPPPDRPEARAANNAPSPTKAAPATLSRPGEFKSVIVDVEEPAPSQAPRSEAPKQPEPVAPAAKPPAGTAEREARDFKQALVSPSTERSVTDSMDRLKKAAMDDAEARVESVLRPMLREWLDENLPRLVERLVREEVSRIARGKE